MVELKSPGEIEAMRAAGRVVAAALAACRAAPPSASRLSELDQVARDVLAEAGATSPFLGYQPSFAHSPFPAVICTSVNDAALHGIPGRYQAAGRGPAQRGLRRDAGRLDRRRRHLVHRRPAAPSGPAADRDRAGGAGGRHRRRGARRAAGRHLGRDRRDGQGGRVRPAHRLRRARRRAHHARVAVGAQRRPGAAAACSWPPAWSSPSSRGSWPAATTATGSTPDGWTLPPADGSRAAHVEHTVAITDDGPLILTAP